METADKLDLSWEWESAPRVRLPEHRVTWSRLEIRLDDERVTLVEDIESGSSRRSIYVPLYPMAEWIALHWWTLLYNSRLSTPALDSVRHIDRARLTGREMRSNNLRSIGDGFAWPDVAIIPAGAQTLISWRQCFSPVAKWNIRYISQGDRVIDSDSLRATLARFIESVITRLDEQGVSETALHKEWQAISGADPDEAAYCRAAARLGLDPYSDETHPFEEEIIRAFNSVPSSLFGDFVDAVAPADLRSAREWVTNASARLTRIQDLPTADISHIRSRLKARTLSYARPWETGWEQARITREATETGKDQRFFPERYVSSQQLPSPESRIRALGKGREHDAAVVVSAARQDSRTTNFLLGRALWHSAVQPQGTFLITDAYTDKQKIERAYAAELLAPASGIAAILNDDPRSASVEDVERIADHFGVSALVIQHQIDNQLAAA